MKTPVFFLLILLSIMSFSSCDDQETVEVPVVMLEHFNRQLGEANEIIDQQSTMIYYQMLEEIADMAKIKFAPVVDLAENIIAEFDLIEDDFHKFELACIQGEVVDNVIKDFEYAHSLKKEEILEQIELFFDTNTITLQLYEEEIEARQQSIRGLFDMDDFLLDFKKLKESERLLFIKQIHFSILKCKVEILSQIASLMSTCGMTFYKYFPVVNSKNSLVRKNDSLQIDIGVGSYWVHPPHNVSLTVGGDTIDFKQGGLAKYNVKTNKIGEHELPIELIMLNLKTGDVYKEKLNYTYKVY